MVKIVYRYQSVPRKSSNIMVTLRSVGLGVCCW